MDENGVEKTIIRGIIYSTIIFFFTFSLGFGIAYVFCVGWIISIPVTVVLLAVIFIITLLLARQLNWDIPSIVIIFCIISGVILCFIHALINIRALSGDLWAVYLSLCFVSGFLLDFIRTTYQT